MQGASQSKARTLELSSEQAIKKREGRGQVVVTSVDIVAKVVAVVAAVVWKSWKSDLQLD